MKAIDLINGKNLGAIAKLGPNKYLFNNETLTFRGLCSTLEEMGVEVTYL